MFSLFDWRFCSCGSLAATSEGQQGHAPVILLPSLREARTRAEAAAVVRKHRPGLILADIQLADGSSGLDAVNDLLNMFEVPVIFITAFPERYLTGARPEPAFLVSKPYRPATLSALVSQALFFERNAVQKRKLAS
jgi:CheY-like chemotaxis protein